MTWNVLADCYSIGQSTKDLSILEWTYRKNHIERFVTASKADILCLQEIDHYKDFYEPFLKNIGKIAGTIYVTVNSCISFKIIVILHVCHDEHGCFNRAYIVLYISSERRPNT